MHDMSMGAFNPSQPDWRNPDAHIQIKRMD
jgi:hypothetical protein